MFVDPPVFPSAEHEKEKKRLAALASGRFQRAHSGEGVAAVVRLPLASHSSVPNTPQTMNTEEQTKRVVQQFRHYPYLISK